MKLTRAISALLLAAPGVCFSQQWTKEPTAVLGVKLGAPLAASALPQCGSGTPTEPCLEQRAPMGSVEFPLYLRGHPFDYVAATIQQARGSVATVRMTLSHDRFEEFERVLITRYGRPTLVETAEVKTRGGAVFPAKTATWSGERISITLFERLGDINTSQAVFADNAYVDRALRERGDQERAKASKL